MLFSLSIVDAVVYLIVDVFYCKYTPKITSNQSTLQYKVPIRHMVLYQLLEGIDKSHEFIDGKICV